MTRAPQALPDSSWKGTKTLFASSARKEATQKVLRMGAPPFQEAQVR